MKFAEILLICILTLIPALAQDFRVTQVATGAGAITDIQHAGDGSGRLFVAQQNGLVRIFRNGAFLAQPFLDIRSITRNVSELGLLGIAFPKNFAATQRFYVFHSNLSGATVISQFRVSGQGDIADSGSEIVLLTISKANTFHTGGQIRFGPDGYLYIAVGDDGPQGDPLGHGQDRALLLGKILRVDVEGTPGQLKIPPTNPFVNTAGARPEIWAYGFRNPWRFSFDRATGALWIGDVGQNMYEEIDFQPASSVGGENYGWGAAEGNHCFRIGCSLAGLTPPAVEYTHADGCSVTGGMVYRGSAFPGVRGLYIYGDYCNGRVWTLERRGTNWVSTPVLTTGFQLTAFGEDEAGEIYLGNVRDGSLHRLEGSRAPRLASAGVVNAASYAQGIVAGSLGTIFASGLRDTAGVNSASSLPLPLSLADVSVTMDGAAVPILSVSNVGGQEQINFQAPFALNGSSAQVIVTRGGLASGAVSVPVLALQPAIYSSDGTQAIVVHAAEYTLVTPAAPLVPGENAFLYASGLGPVSNAPATGAAAPSSPLASTNGAVQVIVGGAVVDAQFAGLAPGFAGVYQVNFRVPAAASGMQTIAVRVLQSVSPVLRVPVRP